jgi:hypothetical protein
VEKKSEVLDPKRIVWPSDEVAMRPALPTKVPGVIVEAVETEAKLGETNEAEMNEIVLARMTVARKGCFTRFMGGPLMSRRSIPYGICPLLYRNYITIFVP